MDFRLDKVDQVWFLGLILGAPIDTETERGCVQPANRAAFEADAEERRVAG